METCEKLAEACVPIVVTGPYNPLQDDGKFGGRIMLVDNSSSGLMHDALGG
jgi:hypothetical protein